jgi:transposase
VYRATEIGAELRSDPGKARRMLLAALEKQGGNVQWAAEALGVHVATARRWIRSLDRAGPGETLTTAIARMRRGWPARRRRPRGYATEASG